ncbi:hypothetical protein C0991_004962 [Blastosporella zonata]|nr:hypothetical protein C0991_004962 [Blastosporella zonata]
MSSSDSPQEPEAAPNTPPESLSIPEVRDGFFGYTEEKSIQHIEEKYWAHRRGSDAHSDASFSGHFKSSALQPPLSEEQLNVTGAALEEEETTLAELEASETILTHEYAGVFESFQRCLDIRDKYMTRSLQRLGDNPKDYDGHQPAIDKDLNQKPARQFEPWNIYPQPPPPHWHWTDQSKVESVDGTTKTPEFRFEDCEIPGSHPWTFRMDHEGVFQVYEDKGLADSKSGEKKPAFNVPSAKEYFDVVIFRDGAYLTLEQVFQSLKLTAYDLSIDTLDMHAHYDSFHRFDKFNLKYNPIGESRLREIFLKTDNHIQGRYLAELTQRRYSFFEMSKAGVLNSS